MGGSVFASDNEKELVNTDGDWQFTLFENDGLKGKNVATIKLPYAGCSSLLYANDNAVEEALDYLFTSSDESVVYMPQKGRILGLKKGSAIIEVTMGEVTNTYLVIVEDEMPEYNHLNSDVSLFSSHSTERRAMFDKASAMYTYMWKPTANLIQWGSTGSSKKYFTANTWQSGIPYSQGTQCDEIEFAKKMSSSDFYSVYQASTGSGTFYSPRYGLDCSGFVSCCWGVPRDNTNGFNTKALNGTYKNMNQSYSSMELGDAVVIPNNHMFMIDLNFVTPPVGSSIKESYVTSYEQTPVTTQSTIWTYSQLRNQGYRAISKFTD